MKITNKKKNRVLSLAATIALGSFLLIGCGSTDSEKTESNSDRKSETTAEKSENNADKNPSNWQEYKSTEGNYSVKVPTKIQEKTEDISLNGSDKTLQQKIAISEFQNSAYAVGYLDYPSEYSEQIANIEKQKGLVDSTLSEAIDGTITDMGGNPDSVKKESIAINNVPCEKFESAVQFEGKDTEIQGIICLDGNRLYEVIAAGPATELDQNAEQFLNSFKIEK